MPKTTTLSISTAAFLLGALALPSGCSSVSPRGATSDEPEQERLAVVLDSNVRSVTPRMPRRVKFFVDIFNILDDQKAVAIQDVVGQPNFGQGLDFVPPQRFFLGARLRF